MGQVPFLLASVAVAATRTKRTPARGRNTRDWQPRFLRTLAATANVSLACQAAKVGRTRAYEARTEQSARNERSVRAKLEPDPANPRYVITEPGIGYRLRAKQ